MAGISDEDLSLYRGGLVLENKEEGQVPDEVFNSLARLHLCLCFRVLIREPVENRMLFILRSARNRDAIGTVDHRRRQRLSHTMCCSSRFAIPQQIRQLILHISNSQRYVDAFVGKLTSAKRLQKHCVRSTQTIDLLRREK